MENLADHIRRQERKGHPRKFLRQTDSQIVNVLSRLVVIDRESGQDIRILSADSSRVVVRRVDAAIRKPDVVNDVGDFSWRELPANGSLDQVTQPSGFFYTCAGWSTYVEIERATIDAREKVLPQPGHDQAQGAEACGKECDQKSATVMEATLEHAMVTVAETLEGFLKAKLHTHERVS